MLARWWRSRWRYTPLFFVAAGTAATAVKLPWPGWAAAIASAVLLSLGQQVLAGRGEPTLVPVAGVDLRVRRALPGYFGIQTTPRGALPGYVRRDAHAALDRAVTEATADGGIVLLVGGAASGKSRLAYEVLRERVGRWRLRKAGSLEALRTLTCPPRTVVWLDRVGALLADQPDQGVELLELLADTHRRVLVIGTLSATERVAITTLPEDGAHDQYAHQVRLLNRATLIDIPDRFSARELRAARTVAERDPRVQEALHTQPGQLTQVLALGRELASRWHNAPDPYSWAVITAAVDAARIGVRAPLGRDFLRDAAAGYLSEVEADRTPAQWLPAALRHATTRVYGAVAPLAPSADGRLVLADYLLQHGASARDAHPVPASVWLACEELAELDDTHRAGESAYNRGYDGHAERLWSAASDRGSVRSALRLADHLAAHGRAADAETLLGPLAARHAAARDLLADLLADQGRVEDGERLWRAALDRADPVPWLRLGQLLESRGRPGEAARLWREAVRQDVPDAHAHLAACLERAGEIAAAESAWSRALALGHLPARRQHASLLARTGRVGGARELLARAVAAGDPEARVQLADLELGSQRPEEAERVLLDGAARGEAPARRRLAALYLAAARPEEAEAQLSAGAADGDHRCRQQLVDLLIAGNELSEAEEHCRAAIRAGDSAARLKLCDVLLLRGRAGEIDPMWEDAAQSGDPTARWQHIGWLIDVGRTEQAKNLIGELAAAGDPRVRERLDDLWPKVGTGLGVDRPHGLEPPARAGR
ncbi:hypothetical protein AB0M43_00605 [Longispora sp. NPDC051575]|uniref:hypothetical protein n=1 Tax=Longispora sp. NPDC051575 TaxID=3154943 RepID=UPI00341F6F69